MSDLDIVRDSSDMPGLGYAINASISDHLSLIVGLVVAIAITGVLVCRRIGGAGTGTRRGGPGRGRHRRGVPRVAWTPIRWDVREQAAAAGLDLVEPDWVIVYRVWARRFYAVPAWPLPGLAGVEAPTIAGLRALMRQAEARAHGLRRARA
ncbi:hypothetical protein GCM10010106_31130 [Thermopolyspora flexuosa]|jgi:hypothetical protein|uniref:Uncharacterized protein n=1 Tax=Thermopolyspora flexuosa TaxID=103836 RepID=A0A543ISK3_9ACTN|nr:hypothetical protein [Thermopolyspora flexuosa]TQM73565.1 hypothetical protein FHX40_0213 [Thermopolyspora flexuosa]GGM82288.1 hypothetical protein GCM10010106_31130 [Thermopolyspora flexuosa]